MFTFLFRSQIPGVCQDCHQALITPWRRRYQVECQAEFYSSPLSLSWGCWHFQVGGLLSVDGTFKSITKNWAHLCAQGVHIPVAMAWLPDKTTLSYYTTLFLLLYTFRQHSEAIQMQCGSSNLKLKRIRCDYEEAIHLGFGRFRLSGCFFLEESTRIRIG